MREIKFRLVKDGKIVGYEKHVVSCGLVQIFHSVKNDDQEGWEWWNVSIKDSWPHFIDHDHKDQFTGLKDKNGREIYDVDFMRSGPGLPLCEVGWEETCGQWQVWHSGGYWFPLTDYVGSDTDPEVIGNIHQNPELLRTNA